VGIFREIINALNRLDKRQLVEALGVPLPRGRYDTQSSLAQTAKRSAAESFANDGIPADTGGIESADPTPTHPSRPTPSGRPISTANASAA
jgi:hypothetical protein